MYRRLWPFLAACFYYTGVVPLVRWCTRRGGRHVIILCYHNANANLRRHLRYLQRHYRIVPLERALEELYAPHQDGVRQEDRRSPLVLTFDDGYFDNYADAFTLARQLRLPFSIFLVPGYIESGRQFWWVEGEYLAGQAQGPTVMLEGQTYQLNQPGGRAALAHMIHTRARLARSVAEREAFLAATRKALGLPAPPDAPARPLGWPEVREMAASGWVSYGAHTMHHPTLARLDDPAEVRREVGECRAVLEQQLGHAVQVFAYPIGRWEDIGAHGVRAVREAGYRWAVTTTPGRNTPRTDPGLLRRIVTDADEHWLVMAAQAAGVWTFFALSRLGAIARSMGRRMRLRRAKA